MLGLILQAANKGGRLRWLNHKQSKAMSAKRSMRRRFRRCIKRIIALIAAGYFFDVIDFTIFGSLVPFILGSKFATGPEVALVGAATIFGMFIGTAGQGQFSDRFGRRFIYQFNLLLFGMFTILGAFAPSVTLLIICRFIAGIGLGAEQPLAFAYAGEYAPKNYPRPHPRHRAFHRRRDGLADRHGARAAARHGDLPRHAGICLARRLAADRRRRARRLGVPLHAAGIAALSGDARPRRRKRSTFSRGSTSRTCRR